MREVNVKAAADALEDVRIKGDDLKITPLKAITPEEAEDAAERLYAMIPNARITGVLADVHRWTGFADAFTHLHTGMPAEDPRVVLTAVLADATNLGLTRMAHACSVASYRKLAWTAGWHLREDTYRQALAILVNAQQRHPLAATVRGRRHIQLGRPGVPDRRPRGSLGCSRRPARQPAIGLVLHPRLVSARAVLYGVDPALGRSGLRHRRLLYHEADLTTAVHHTDGGGVSDHAFALAHLLGFRFAPRIPNLADRKLYAFGSASTWPALAPFIGGQPDEKLIMAQWDDVLRLTASVRTGTVSGRMG